MCQHTHVPELVSKNECVNHVWVRPMLKNTVKPSLKGTLAYMRMQLLKSMDSKHTHTLE